ISVVPDGRAVPRRRCERTVPLRRHVVVAAEPRQPVAEIIVAVGQWDAAAARRTDRIDLLQCSDQSREVARRENSVYLLDRHGLTLDPGMHGPKPRVIVSREPLCDGDRW